eukprot:5152478-Lingulodinium_polyedra.AAC.1
MVKTPTPTRIAQHSVPNALESLQAGDGERCSCLAGRGRMSTRCRRGGLNVARGETVRNRHY